MGRKRASAATPEEVAAFDFEPWAAKALPALPSLKDWLQWAKDDLTLTAFATSAMGKTKAELVTIFETLPDETMELLEAIAETERRLKAGAKLMRAASVRLIIAGSAVAVAT